jgi:hypothetical protein
MMLNQDYKEMLLILIKNNVDFMVIGAYALAHYGFPRSTGDIDIFINPNIENSILVHRSLVEFGAPVRLFDVSSGWMISHWDRRSVPGGSAWHALAS